MKKACKNAAGKAKKLIVILLLASLCITILPPTASANSAIAWGAANTVGNGVRIRSGPGLDNSVLTHVGSGEVMVILERTNSEWYKVNYQGTVGYTSVPLLDNQRTIANFNAQGSISGGGVNMRAKPDTSSSVLGTYSYGTVMNVIGLNEGWYKVEYDGNTGYVRSDLMQIVSRSSSSGKSSPGSSPELTLGQQIADYACSFKGSRYVYGGMSPSGFDCSGLVTYVYKQYGISVTRNASGQYRDNGVHIDKSNLYPGDLVFFSRNGNSVTHVGIYIGNNKFVHASGSRVGVIISDLGSAYYTRVWFGAKRLV